MAELAQYIEATAKQLLGDPSSAKPNEWRYGNHGSLAVDLEAGTWFDHERDEGGGVLDLVMRETQATCNREALLWLEDKGIKPVDVAPQKPKRTGKPKLVKTYDYVDSDGVLQYQVCRYEPKDFRQRKPGDAASGGWNWSVKGMTSLPYRLPDILANPTATILIVGGEKDADAIAAMDLIATTNSGGEGKWSSDLVPYFAGRRVVIIPDNDDAGRKHSQLVASALYDAAQSIRILTLQGLPAKGDVSDWLASGGDRSQLIDLCRDAPTWEPETLAISVPDSAPPLPDEPEAPAKHTGPFRALGYNADRYYYLSRGTEQVGEIRRGAHTSPAEMLSLAAIEWWEMQYPKGDNGGIDWQLAASDCMRLCERAGIYSIERERGRGAWYDRGRSVLHLGDRMLVDGAETRISDHASNYIYTRQAPMESGVSSTPATDTEANAVVDIFESLNWSKPVHAMLSAGWCALAPICGAMHWRPHVWLTAQRGAGKSWAQEHIIAPLIGPAAMMVQGSTTEAGLRQRLKQDARPIVFDEAESEEQNSQRRVQLIVELARQASSDGGAEIVKGTSSGTGMAFRIRSMFMMSSINVALTQAADESRFSVLSLRAPEKTPAEIARFSAFEKRVAATLTNELCASVRARSYKLMPVIRINAKTLSRAVAERLGSQRIGDQVGTLMAGYYSLLSSGEISLEDARVMCAKLDFSDAKEAESVSDEESCLARILQAQVRFDSRHGTMQRSIAEIVRGASGQEILDALSQSEANAVLGRFGLLVDGTYLAVSNTHVELQTILKNSAWGAGWKRVLARIDGAKSAPEAVRFAGARSRATLVPLSFVG